MAVTRINKDLPTTTKIDQLNDMILEIYGLVAQGKFDINELNNIYGTTAPYRRFKRNVAIGSTLSTYTGWSHIKAEDGYSIWKYSPTNYKYNAVNQVYFDNRVLENRGQATSETATTFDSVFLFNGDSGSGYTNNTSEAGTETGTEFSVNNTVNDFLYLGASSTFGGIKFEWQTRGSNYSLVVQYFNGTSWTTLTTAADNLEDGTNNFKSNGHITWTIPNGWNTTTINSSSKYWIRISSVLNPITVAKAYYIIPSSSVIGKLALSSTEVLQEEWAWCEYNGSIYVTIRNAAPSAYEGDLFITSSSTSANLQNFFIYNHPFTADYESSLYATYALRTVTTSDTITTDDAVIIVNTSGSSITLTLPTAVGNLGKRFIIKNKVIGGGLTVTLDALSGELIDNATTYTVGDDYSFVEIISDNARWLIIRKQVN